MKAAQKLILIAAFFAVGCSAPPVAPETKEERVRREQKIGRTLSTKYSAENKLKLQKADLRYLEKLTRLLMDNDPELATQTFEIHLVSAQSKTWDTFSFPGNLVYLSAGTLRQLSVESEAAALIALELGRLKTQLVAKRLADEIQKSEPFAFGVEEEEQGMEAGVTILYQSLFDARAMVRMLEKHFKFKKKSQYDEERLIKLVELARAKSMLLPPIRNPKVNSNEFKTFQQTVLAPVAAAL